MFGLKFAIPAVGFIIASPRRNPITPNEINLATKRRNRALDIGTIGYNNPGIVCFKITLEVDLR